MRKKILIEMITGILPYPPENAVIVIYNFLVNENSGQKNPGLIYDFGTEEFKYPMSMLNQHEYFWTGTKTNGETNKIEGTNISWKIEKEMFVFWLE